MTAKLERAAMARLIDTLGAEITISMQPHEPMSVGKLVVTRLRSSHTSLIWPTLAPSWPGDGASARAVVTILAMPNTDELRVDQWGKGRAAMMLRSTLNQAGVSCRDEVAYVAADGTQAMWDAIRAADAPYLLLVGGTALSCWRDDVRLQQLAGGMFPLTAPSGYQTLAGMIAAPEAVLAGHMDAARWREQVTRWVARVVEGRGIEDVTWWCVEWLKDKERPCGAHAYGWDRGGLPWCRDHLPGAWEKSEKARAKVAKNANASMQEGMSL